VIVSVAGKIAAHLRESLLLGPSFPLRQLSGFLGRKYHVASIRGIGSVHIRPDNSDADVFIKVFGKREYDISRFPQSLRMRAAYQAILDAARTPIIIDAGANVGAASLWFAQQFPLARILAVEPDPANAELCRLNTQSCCNVEVIEAAVGSDLGWVSLHQPEGGAGWAVRTVRNSDDGKVPVRTIRDLAQTGQGAGQLFVVKVDIEGFERDLFESNTEWVDEVEVLVIEPHDWMLPGKRTSSAFQKVMAGRDFELLISGENLFYCRFE
jgi:FkbM family methyltransferase